MAAAHPRVVICVSLRTAASAEAPLSPMLLYPILQARGGTGMVREKACQWALTERQTLGSGGALQRGHSASLEPLAQRNDALSGGKELVILVVIPTKVVALQTASAGKEAAW